MQQQPSILRKILKFIFGSVIIQALLLALIIRSFIFQPFSIPSSSMKPTLLVGDYIFVSKWSYGFSRHSLPFGHVLPFFTERIFFQSPERGDIIVFKYPNDPSINYVKRLIGLPGDRVQLKNSQLYINGEKINRIKDGRFEDIVRGQKRSHVQYKESISTNRSYHTLDIASNSLGDSTKIFTIPEKHYFFLGDNRDNSADSRFDVGMVAEELLVGKANIIFLSIESSSAWQFWLWPQNMRFARLFASL